MRRRRHSDPEGNTGRVVDADRHGHVGLNHQHSVSEAHRELAKSVGEGIRTGTRIPFLRLRRPRHGWGFRAASWCALPQAKSDLDHDPDRYRRTSPFGRTKLPCLQGFYCVLVEAISQALGDFPGVSYIALGIHND